MKKICFVVEKLYNGGAERVVSILSNSLAKKGYRVTIVCFEKGRTEYALDEAVSREFIDSSKGIAGKFFGTVRYLLKTKFDVVIGFDILPNLICSFTSFLSHKKIIISERNAPNQVRINPLLKIARFILYSSATTIVFQTNEAMSCYRKGISQKGVVIHNPVNPNLPQRSDVHNKEIVAMGRLTSQKNYELLIKAAKRIHEDFPDYIFRIFGQGELEYELKMLINDLDVGDYVFLEGYYEDACSQIVDSDIYVLTSHYEGMPNSLIEAMCMGFPVVASDCPSGGPKELIRSGENGLLFINDDIDDFIKKVNILIKHMNYKEQLAKNARMLNESLAQEKIVKKWEEVF